MEGITIQAASPESARAMLAALSQVQPSCAADGCQVVISLSGQKGELVAVLDALEEYVTTRATGPTRLELNGHKYVMEPGSAGLTRADRALALTVLLREGERAYRSLVRPTPEGFDRKVENPPSESRLGDGP